ncbi:MAG: hypothetical protein CME66_09295 [Halobacteriovoraceae bacterium]|nr:hypothetical protein [Halobacteriovoraceae bacterium]
MYKIDVKKLSFAFIILFFTQLQAKTHILRSSHQLFQQVEKSHLPTDWHLLDHQVDGLLGLSLFEAQKNLKEYCALSTNKKITIAIIDSGFDVLHPIFKSNLWINEKEIPNNGIDDDKNGYTDDIIGWNFLGNKNVSAHYSLDGQNLIDFIPTPSQEHLRWDSLAKTRRLKQLKIKNELDELSVSQQLEYKQLQQEIDRKQSRAKKLWQEYKVDLTIMQKAYELLQVKAPLSLEQVKRITAHSKAQQQAKSTLIKFKQQGTDLVFLQEQVQLYQVQANIHYNIDYDGREKIIKDKDQLIFEKGYGNNDIYGPNALHGTHVAGITSALLKPFNQSCTQIKIMPIKAIPDGDERDKDIINALNYALDNGANIINLSFGKFYSAHKAEVQKVLLKAKKQNTLIIQAAGNEYLDLDSKPSYPSAFIQGKKLENYLVIGASTPHKDENVFASFSNYGKKTVDMLAPGVLIHSATPEFGHAKLSGTSTSAPMVSALAGIILAANPDLTAQETITRLKQGATDLNGLEIFKTGLGTVKLEDIVVSPKIINFHKTLLYLLNRSFIAKS